jgi:hypothetical protein
MRKEWTVSEKKLIDSFLKFQVKKGISVILHDNHKDCPDFIVSIEGILIGCEISILTDEYFKKKNEFIIKRTKPGEQSTIEIDYRPDLWIKNAINKKNKLHKKYVKGSGTSEQWLFLDAGLEMLAYDDEMSLSIFREHANKIFHEYRKIWIFFPDKDKFELIFKKGEKVKNKIRLTVPPTVIITHHNLSLEKNAVNLDKMPRRFYARIFSNQEKNSNDTVEENSFSYKSRGEIPISFSGLPPEINVAIFDSKKMHKINYFKADKNGEIHNKINDCYIGRKVVIVLRKYGLIPMEINMIVCPEGIYVKMNKDN